MGYRGVGTSLRLHTENQGIDDTRNVCGAGEIVWGIQCLLCKHEDLSPIPSTHVKPQRWAAEDSRTPGVPGQLASLS